MAWDKVTEIDSIAKRKPYTKVNAGLMSEYSGAYHRAGERACSEFKCPNSARQNSIMLTRSGKFRRVGGNVGADINLYTNTPTVR